MSASTPNPESRPGRGSTTRLEQAAASDESISNVHAQLLREKPEPTEGFSPFPILLVFLVSALMFFGGIYLVRFGGEFEALAFDPAPRGSATVAQGPTQVDPMRIGGRLYNQNCAACHQQSGMGAPGVYPPLVDSEWVTGSEDRLIRILLSGLSGPIVVKGNTYNNAMPAFGPQSGYRFNEEKIAHVLTYIRGTWGNSAPPVTVEKVKEVMATAGTRTSPWTAAELEPFE